MHAMPAVRIVAMAFLAAAGASVAAPFAYIANSGSGTVSVIDTEIRAVVVTVAVGNEPFGVAVNAAGTRAYVGNRASNSVSVIDGATQTVVSTVAVGVEPIGVAVNPAGTRVYVANGGSDTVSVIDAATSSVVATVPVGRQPFGIVVNPAGTRVYVANRGAGSVSVIDALANAVVSTIVVGVSPTGVALNASGTSLYVGSDAAQFVSLIDTGSNAMTFVLPMDIAPWAVATNRETGQIYVRAADDRIRFSSPGNDAQFSTTLRVGTGPGGAAAKPGSTRELYVVNSGSNSVSLVDTPNFRVLSTIAVGERPIAFGQFIAPALPVPGGNPEINQHGLSGSWYEESKSGQGIQVEVFADPLSGQGSAFVSWFTYDSVIGGAERQRWYTAQGPVATGQSSATLTIYQNTGGNFEAGPATTARAVGTATLSFDTCSTGLFTYRFEDGTGRAGAMRVRRIMRNVTCTMAAPFPVDPDFALSGNWYGGPTTSGQGLSIEFNPETGGLFAAWYTYLSDGTAAGAGGQRWYSVQGAVLSGMRSTFVVLVETTGGLFDMPTTQETKWTSVGSGMLTFQSCTSATMSYTFTAGSHIGRSGTLNLSRIGPIPAGCRM